MAMTKDGKHKSSKFRANRADREHEKSEPKMREPGERAEANEMEDKPEKKMGGMDAGMSEKMGDQEPTDEPMGGEQMGGDHSEIQQVTAEHGPAHSHNMTHDHEHETSHNHTIHMDGHEHHKTHQGPNHVMMAHHHAMHASGMTPPEEPQEPQGEMPMGGDEDDYSAPPL